MFSGHVIESRRVYQTGEIRMIISARLNISYKVDLKDLLRKVNKVLYSKEEKTLR